MDCNNCPELGYTGDTQWFQAATTWWSLWKMLQDVTYKVVGAGCCFVVYCMYKVLCIPQRLRGLEVGGSSFLTIERDGTIIIQSLPLKRSPCLSGSICGGPTLRQNMEISLTAYCWNKFWNHGGYSSGYSATTKLSRVFGLSSWTICKCWTW